MLGLGLGINKIKNKNTIISPPDPYGPEKIVNGTFDSDASGWSVTTGTSAITYDSGKGRINKVGTTGQVISIENGRTYKIKADISKISESMTAKVRLGTYAGGANYYTTGNIIADESFEHDFTAPETNETAYFSFVNASDDYHVDNVSIREIL